MESPLNASKTYGEKVMVMSGWGDQGSEREGGRGSEGEEREGAGAIERPPSPPPSVPYLLGRQRQGQRHDAGREELGEASDRRLVESNGTNSNSNSKASVGGCSVGVRWVFGRSAGRPAAGSPPPKKKHAP